LEAEITEESIEDFVEKWVSGKLKAKLKTEEIPAEPYENGVRLLVGANLFEVATDTSKDVLVLFHAPWCGHCKKLKPEFEKAAEMLSHVGTLVLAKMDATTNDAEGITITGFPTLKFFPGGSDTHVDYGGPR